MKLLLSMLTLAATWTAYAQGTSEAILNYTSNASGLAPGTAGWTFQTSAFINVTDLGCFADVFVNNPGITNIEVGLWDQGGNLLASNSVSSSSTLLDQTRYVSITPLLLSPSTTYSIGIYSPGGSIGLDVVSGTGGNTASTSAGITLGQIAFSPAGFAFPSEYPGGPGSLYAGPNFQYQPGVPEPSSCLLLCLGGLLLAARPRNRRL